MSVGLIQDLKDNGFEIAYIGSRNDKILVSVYNEVTYEKASRNTQEIMQRGYRTRDRIEQQRWVWLWNSEYKEVVRLRAELKSKEESIQQLCKRVVDLKNEKEAIESGVNMFALFFDTVEMLQK